MSAKSKSEMRRSSFVTWFTFGVGVPAGVGALYLINHGPWQSEVIQRYVQHLAEQAVVVLFFCCLAALLAKTLVALKERYALGQTLVPSYDGKPIPPSEVTKLQQALNLLSNSVRNTTVGRRVSGILNFVASRNSAADLDDQMRTLADNDAIALDGSYALMRFIIWAMPILGFLGTVLGITAAIAGIDPEQLEKGGAGAVTDGLTQAFDATALALGLTLVAMFINSMVEKLEQGVLEGVDAYVDAELAHRFERTAIVATSGGAAPATSMPMLEQLLERQAALWAASMQKLEERMVQAPQTEKAAALLQQAVEASLARFGQRIVDLEKKLLERHQALLEGMIKVTVAHKENGQDQQLALARLTDAIGSSVEMIAKMQAGEEQLLRLQEVLNQNLFLLANSATFKQAVESLTTAVTLLTTRVQPTPRIVPMTKDAA
ncbi:MAG TPA: MotA/TolQ/ExbB proton channel family protein [Gemmataceae bacterium]|nr:MotA/TolQ/ExbB proton channel family protein [Gemmataceae bacterium]